MSGAARDIAALAAAVGVVGLLAPLPLMRSEAQRAAATAVTLAAWALLLGSLIPGADARNAFDRFTSPTGVVAGAVAVVVAVVVVVVGVRLILARPIIWFVLLGLAMPIRIPVTIGKTDGNLLVPLYAVILLGLAAWVWGRIRGRITERAGEGPPVLTWPLAAFVGFLLVSTLWSADSAEAAKKAVFFYIPFTLLYALTVAWWPRARALRRPGRDHARGRDLRRARRALAVREPRHLVEPDAPAGERLQPLLPGQRDLLRPQHPGALPGGGAARLRRPGVGAHAPGRAGAAGRERGRDGRGADGDLLALERADADGGARDSSATRALGARRALVSGAVLLVLAGGLAIATSGNVRHALTDSHRLERVSEGRFNLMKGGLTIWREQPVAGAGLGGFQTRFEQTLTPVEQRRVRVVISHNSPITVLSEGGVIGFALFLALLGGGGWAVVRDSRDQGQVGWARWTLGAILVGILVHSLLYAAFFEDPFVWVATGAAVALALSVPRAPEVVEET